MADIVTGEAVALDLRTASVPSRLLAGLLDLVLQFGVFWLLTIAGTAVLAGADGGLAAALLVALVVAVFVGYPVTMETLTRGRTLGKMALGLRVVRVDGGPIGFRQALVRGLFAGLLEKPGFLFGATVWVAVLVMLVSRNARRLGDLAAGTVVLQERVPTTAPRADVVAMPPALAGWAPLLDLGRLDDRLALSARQFLARFTQLEPAARERLGHQLAGAVAAVTTPPPPEGTPAWAYLSAVLAERRRRATPASVPFTRSSGASPHVPVPVAPSPHAAAYLPPPGAYLPPPGPPHQPVPTHQRVPAPAPPAGPFAPPR